MVSRQEKVRAGVFVVGSFVLLVLSLTALKYYASLKPSRKYYFYYEYSVAGLDVGSKVTFKGVPIGRVKNIGLISGDYSKIRVVLDINVPEEELPILEGTKVRLDFVSFITGALFVELTYTEKDGMKGSRRYHDPAKPLEVETTLMDNLETYLENLNKAVSDLLKEENRKKVAELLDAVRDTAKDISGTARKTQEVLASVKLAVDESRAAIAENRDAIRKAIYEAGTSLDRISSIVEEIQEKKLVQLGTNAVEAMLGTVEENRAALKEAVASASKTLAALQKMVGHMQEAQVAQLVPDILKEMKAAVGKVKEIGDRGRQAVDRISKLVDSAGKELLPALSDAREAVASARQVLDRTTKLVDESSGNIKDITEKVRDAAGKINALVGKLDTLVGNKAPTMERTLDNLRRASHELKELVKEIRRQPSTLIGRSPKDERKFPK